jgi:pyruvate dehydrogenase E2 component (dihydrolipoamide acetyltransferase)
MQTVKRIRSGDTSARKLGTTYMTITNLGVTNIEAFLPIINPPEPAILGIGRVAAVPHVQDGKLIVQHRVNLTLTVDHRVASGRYASAFLQSVVNELEAIE